jgi:uncharacterized membrane protein
MEWLFIFGLGLWVWLMWNRVEVLTRRVEELTRALGQAQAKPAEAPPAPAPDPRGELLLDTPLPPEAPVDEPKPLWVQRLADDREPLLLTEVVPPAANDEANTPSPALEPVHEAPRVFHAAEPAAPKRDRALETWLAENGLAWMGGALLVLGGAFIVTFAAQQGFFTPLMRLGAATLLGAVLIGASEWVRRGGRWKLIDHPLAAALLAGAGASTLYAASWAAYGVLHYVEWGWAAILLAACSLSLLGLSFLHGQALGVLAVIGAMLAPPLTTLNGWPASALTLYVCVVGAAGFGVAALQRWAWVAAATVAGLYVWFVAAVAAADMVRALALLTFASAGGAAMGLRKPLSDDSAWRVAGDTLPSGAICVSSVLLLWTWLSLADAPAPRLDIAMLVGLLHVALAAGAVRARVAHAAAFATAATAFVFGAMVFLQARTLIDALSDNFYIWALASATAIGGSALLARADRHGRALTAGAGAIGAALMALLAVFSRDAWSDVSVWAPLFAGAALLAAAAHVASKQVATPDKDWATDLWALASAGLVIVGLESLSPFEVRPAMIAASAAGFAFVLDQRGWRGLGWAALAAATLSLAHALSGDFVGDALAGFVSIWQTLSVLGAAAASLFVASYLATPRQRDAGEALSSGAILVALLAAFHALRWIAAGGAGARLDGFTETALHVLTLIAAGYLALPRGPNAGLIARARGHVLMGAGLLYALLQFGIASNLWWGSTPALTTGPILFNTHALAFAAPAALASAASSRMYERSRAAGRAYGLAGALFWLMWAVLELRRAFHGDAMSTAAIGLLEAHSYGLAALLASLIVVWVSRQRVAINAERPFTHDLALVSRGVAVAGIVVAALIMLVLRHPWWGAQWGDTTAELSTSLSVLAQALAVVLSLYLGRALSRGDGLERSRFLAASAAAVFAWSFGHSAIRWLHHRAAMDDGGALSGLEGFAHALWPLTLVLAASSLTQRAPGRDTVRAYLHDLEALWGTAIWPAMAWAAFGLWFVFNPWWGWAPASAATWLAAAIGLTSLLLAAWFSAYAHQTPHIRWRSAFESAARVACVGHLFVALSLTIRRLYQGPDMRAALEAGSLETWTYSALWAVFGAGVLMVGTVRSDSALRWSALAILFGVAAKVGLFDMSELDGLIRAGSFLGLGAVAMVAALAAQRLGKRVQAAD